MYLCSVLCPCPVASLVLKVLKQHFGSGINANECAVSLGIFAFYLRFACGIHKQEKWQQQQQQQQQSSLSALCVVFTSCAQVTFLIAPLRLH